FARPLTPSVPKRRATWLALRVLRRLAGLLQAVLLGLLLPRVAREQSRLLERGAQLGVELDEGPCDPEAHRAGLARDAAAVDRRVDVVSLGEAAQPQGLNDDHAVRRGREVLVEGSVVHRDHARARTEADARDRLLATSGALGQWLGHRSPQPRRIVEVS